MFHTIDKTSFSNGGKPDKEEDDPACDFKGLQIHAEYFTEDNFTGSGEDGKDHQGGDG